jgi:hypothetical protein
MRLALVVVAAAGCHVYDPLDDIQFREYADTQTAIHAILDDVPTPRVYAVGEYHMTRKTTAQASPLARFSREIIGLLAPHAHHLIVEAWLDDGCRRGDVTRQVAAATDRSPATATDLQALVVASRRLAFDTRGLPMTCIEYGSMLDPKGRVDFLRLLELVTDKLGETTRAALAADPDRAVIVYGGALHNDLYPNWPLAELSYAAPLAQELGGHVLEIDLVVPEVVAGMPLVRHEPWFPLLARAAPERVMVWERGPSSYVVILPAQQAALAGPISLM